MDRSLAMPSTEIHLKCSRHSLERSTRMLSLWMRQASKWNYWPKLRVTCTEMPSRRETSCSPLTCMSHAHAPCLSSSKEAPRWLSSQRLPCRVMVFTQLKRRSRERLWSSQEWSLAWSWSLLVRAIARQTSCQEIWLSQCKSCLMTLSEEWEMTWSIDTRCRWLMHLPTQ